MYRKKGFSLLAGWFDKKNKKKSRQQDEAFRILFDLFYDRVFKTAYYITKDTYLAQDVLQETFVKAYHHMDRIENGEKIGAWLTVIATNTAIDMMRKRKVWNGMPTEDVILMQALEQDEIASTVEQAVELRMDKERLRSQMALLKPEYRQVLLLKYHEGLRDEEAARLLGVTVGTVKSRAHRAKHQLKKLLLRADAANRPISGSKGERRP